ncbi:phosphoglucosamine mutase [Sorangium sp. So ce296]|uniref:phosphoglucosamine mutase n=1 Tax=Sorangium sp. So ce296 TaxID=3133296 RepID=UPI003F5E01C9
MGKYFGTDGVRGIANLELTPELAFRLGRCGGHALAGEASGATFVVGRDTRVSGPMLEAAIVAGLSSIGASVIHLGVVTTPVVAYLTRHLGARAGIMISASHNPAEDNGVKFFGADGFKLPDEMEKAIEQLLDAPEDRLPRPVGGQLRAVSVDAQAKEAYLRHLTAAVPARFDGARVVLDCANGGAYELAPRVFRELGADVVAIGVAPDGLNINDACGSLHVEALREEVLRRGAQLGLSFDGDADRLVAVDERGAVVDGDEILYVCASAAKRERRLAKDTIVTTVMSNAGLAQAAGRLGVATKRTEVGDRHVVAEMRRGGYNLGGEPSGHVVWLDHATTGDGILAGLLLLDVVRRTGRRLSELTRPFERLPQVRADVMVADRNRLSGNPAIAAVVRRVERELGAAGRMVVRASGTEPVVRIMAEGLERPRIEAYVKELADVIARELSCSLNA